MAGMPSSTEPRMANTTIDSARKPMAPPGMCVIAQASCCEKPDWVSAQAMAVAVPRMIMIDPDIDRRVAQHRPHAC